MADKAETFISPEAYLETERRADYRSEYVGGEVFAMTGASRAHNRIVSNLVSRLDAQLLERPCNVYSSGFRVHIASKGIYTYPDVMVTCGEERLLDSHFDTLLNPLLIVEVLSESTEAYDRGLKFENYQLLESLQEYLLVSQQQARVEHFVRQQTGVWLYTVVQGLEGGLHLPTIDCHLKLRQIYRNVTF